MKKGKHKFFKISKLYLRIYQNDNSTFVIINSKIELRC